MNFQPGACLSPTQQELKVPSLAWEDPLEKEMATTSVFLPKKFHGQRTWPATVHGSQRVRQD